MGMPSCTILMSVPQIPHARTRTRTSSSPSDGTVRSSTSKRCGSISTVAFMVCGTAIDCSPFGGSAGARGALHVGEVAQEEPCRKRLDEVAGTFHAQSAGPHGLLER